MQKHFLFMVLTIPFMGLRTQNNNKQYLPTFIKCARSNL